MNMKKFDANYYMLEDMYEDDYYPTFWWIR